MNLQRLNVLTAASLALVLTLAAPATGAEARGDALAAVSALGDQVAWVPSGGATRLALSVSGPNTNFTERFAGSTPVFSLFDENGAGRPDGVYTWELREEAAPVNDRVRDRANGRDMAAHDSERRIEVQSRVQSGTFTIQNGAVVDSSLAEAKPSRPAKD